MDSLGVPWRPRRLLWESRYALGTLGFLRTPRPLGTRCPLVTLGPLGPLDFLGLALAEMQETFADTGVTFADIKDASGVVRGGKVGPPTETKGLNGAENTSMEDGVELY